MFNKEKLELMYFLTKNQKFMNRAEAAKAFSKYKGISERTVRRWFKDLQKYRFDYWPALHYRNFGLHWVSVIIENLRNHDFLKTHPYLVYVYPGINFQNLKKTLVLGYLIPEKNLPDFENFLSTAKNKGFFDSYFSFAVKTAIPYAYTPFHEIVLPDGHLQFCNGYDVSNFTAYLNEVVQKSADPEVSDFINKNPMLVPVLFEYLREHWSSRKVWFNAKRKLGPKIWDYVRSIKKRKKQKDSIGIRLVQEATRQVNQNAGKFFLQTKIDYFPFHYKTIVLSIFLKLKDISVLPALCEAVAKNSLMSAFSVGKHDNKLLGLYIMTNSEKVNHILCNILPNDLDAKFKTKIICLNQEEFLAYYGKARHYMKFDYSKVFDPKKCEWIYETDKYMSELQKLAG